MKKTALKEYLDSEYFTNEKNSEEKGFLEAAIQYIPSLELNLKKAIENILSRPKKVLFMSMNIKTLEFLSKALVKIIGKTPKESDDLFDLKMRKRLIDKTNERKKGNYEPIRITIPKKPTYNNIQYLILVISQPLNSLGSSAYGFFGKTPDKELYCMARDAFRESIKQYISDWFSHTDPKQQEKIKSKVEKINNGLEEHSVTDRISLDFMQPPTTGKKIKP